MSSRSILKLALALTVLLLAAVSLSADLKKPFLPTEKAYYADEARLNFVRPGLVIKVTKVEIAADGTTKAWVKFTDPMGAPLDRTGVMTPGPITVSFLSAYIPADQPQYVSYITRQRTGGGRTVTQATGESTGAWTQTGDGEYTYTFANKAPAGIDRTATHTVGVYGSRNLNEFELGVSRADTVFNYVPSGAAVTKVRDVVRTSSCNKCHDQLAFHGGNRRSVELCVICHTPQTPEPVSGNTTDMKVMVHKIHMGQDLPSVIAGGKYGFGTNTDYSTVANPSPNMACVVCHEPQKVSGAAQADNWFNKPARDTCGSCHDDVNFDTGKNHADLPQISDNQCANCHPAKGEVDFDTSVQGAHVVPAESSLLPGVRFTIDAAADVAPGKKPTITFSIKDKAGKPYTVSQLSSLRVYSGGPTTDIAGYFRETVAATAAGPGNGVYFWTFSTPIPEDAKGSWQFGIEGYRNVTILAGTMKQRTIRDVGPNVIFAASLDGSKAVPRRTVVASATCNKCHYSLSFHGGNRNDAQMCVFCHNSSLTEGENNTSWNYVNMIHRYHGEEVRYPGRITNCTQCHVGNSQSLPMDEGVLPVKNGEAPVNPTPPTTNACLVCHNSTPAWAHAKGNMNEIGEACSVCHGANSQYSVNKVHAQ